MKFGKKDEIMEEEKKQESDLPESMQHGEERKKRKMPGKRKKRSRFSSGFLAGLVAALVAAVVISEAGALVQSLFGTGTYASGSVSSKDVEKKLNLIHSLIDRYYLYGEEVDEDSLIQGIYDGYMDDLGDPYSTYFDEEETKALMESTSGEFCGIGATMSQNAEDGTITVTEVYEDSPAEKAGMKEGDILVQVDDRSTTGNTLETVVTWVKGEKGTEVVLHVMREGTEVELKAVRDVIQTKTVAYEMKEDHIGYVSISEFDTVTYDQFCEALNELESDGMEGLVIDLRNNPGGNLDTVCDILRLLLPEGIIVTMKDKDGNITEETSDGENEFTKPLVVLVNQYSASASELFSGAVQDYGTGTIVGKTTYGKGVVQQMIDLGDGTCLKLTIAEYFTPKGRTINGIGVEPDVEVEYIYDENNPESDNQLEKALEIVRKEIKN